jgi:hypothetical protein
MRRRFAIPLVLVVFLIVAGVAYVAFTPSGRLMFSVGRDLIMQYRTGFNIALSGRDLSITLTGDKFPKDTAARRAFALRIARSALAKMEAPVPVDTIGVVLQDKSEAGPVSVTRGMGAYRWSVEDLRRPQPRVQVATNAPPTVTPAGTPTKGSPAGRGAKVAAVAAAPSAFQRLAASDPAVRWVRDSALIADIDCDQAPDTVVIGRARTEIHVGLARAADQVPQILVFDVGQAKGTVHSARAKFALESLDTDPAERGLAGMEGFSRSATCKGITLGERGQRQLHLLWSEKTRHLEWFQR